MRRFIRNTLLFFVVGWSLFYGLDLALSRVFQRSTYSAVNYWTNLMKGGIDADVIFLGSSRILNHVVPSVFDSVLSLNSYNFGMAGAHFDDLLSRYRLYRERNESPDVVLIGLDYFSLMKNSGAEKYQFYPWFNDRSFREAVFQARQFSLADRFLPMYRYGSVWMDYLFNDYGEFEKGFYPQDPYFKGDGLERITFPFAIDSEVEKAFNTLLDLIDFDGAKAVLIQPPMYESALRKWKDPHEMLDYYDSLSRRRDIPFLDYARFSLSGDTSYFFNALHMNRRGAEVFTDSLARDLKRLGLVN